MISADELRKQIKNDIGKEVEKYLNHIESVIISAALKKKRSVTVFFAPEYEDILKPVQEALNNLHYDVMVLREKPNEIWLTVEW